MKLMKKYISVHAVDVVNLKISGDMDALVIRDRFELMATILKVAKNGSTKTHIKNSANLSSSILKHYLDFLMKLNLIVEGNSYHTTEKGLEFICAFERLQRILASPV